MFEPLRRITLREIRLPLREPFRTSSGEVSERRILLLELEDESGLTTWSECVALELPNYSPETIDTAWLALGKWVAPRLLGRRLSSLEEIHHLLDENFRGHLMAKAAVEMGCWALEASHREIPLAELLGGVRREVATGISLGIQASPEALVAKVQEAVAAGYRKVKIKIGPGKDLTYLAAVRTAIGFGPLLMADANSAYTFADADHLERLDVFHLMMIEQPLAWDDQRRHAELQDYLDTPICLDESITGVASAEDMIALGSGQIINLKPGRVGGFTASKAIHDLSMKHDIPLWCGGMLESGIGRAYNVALAALPNFTLPGDLSPSSRYWQRDLVTPEWTMNAEGMVQVPWDRPGLGVEVDRDWIEELTVRVEVLEG